MLVIFIGYHYEFTIVTNDAIFADLNDVIVVNLYDKNGTSDQITLPQ